MRGLWMAGMCFVAAGTASAQELARVISSTPVVQQVGVPRQACSSEQVVVQPAKSGAGALMGAVAGGAVGNAVGGGSGRALATVIGVIGGALMGDRVEGSPSPQVQHVQNCRMQTFMESRVVAYNVRYEYAGKQYSVQLPQDPGPTLRIQVSPVIGSPGTAPGATLQPQPVYPPPVQAPQTRFYPRQPALPVETQLDRWPDGSVRPPGGEDLQRYQ